MQLSGLAIISQPSPVVDAIGGIGGLLHLDYHRTLQQSMHRSRGHVYTISRPDRHKAQYILDAPRIDRRDHGGTVHPRTQAIHDPGALIGRQDVPALDLAPLSGSVQGSVGVIRVHLHRQIALGIEQLDQQRKAARVRQGGTP
jgi:hypothetical protein